jgi:hypothetical protein
VVISAMSMARKRKSHTQSRSGCRNVLVMNTGLAPQFATSSVPDSPSGCMGTLKPTDTPHSRGVASGGRDLGDERL